MPRTYKTHFVPYEGATQACDSWLRPAEGRFTNTPEFTTCKNCRKSFHMPRGTRFVDETPAPPEPEQEREVPMKIGDKVAVRDMPYGTEFTDGEAGRVWLREPGGVVSDGESVAMHDTMTWKPTVLALHEMNFAPSEEKFRLWFGSMARAQALTSWGEIRVSLSHLMNGLGVTVPAPLLGMPLVIGDATLTDRLPVGTILQAGIHDGEHDSWSVIQKSDAEDYVWEILDGCAPTSLRTYWVFECPEGTVMGAWQRGVGEVETFKQRLWDATQRARTSDDWCADFDRGLSRLGLDSVVMNPDAPRPKIGVFQVGEAYTVAEAWDAVPLGTGWHWQTGRQIPNRLIMQKREGERVAWRAHDGKCYPRQSDEKVMVIDSFPGDGTPTGCPAVGDPVTARSQYEVMPLGTVIAYRGGSGAHGYLLTKQAPDWDGRDWTRPGSASLYRSRNLACDGLNTVYSYPEVAQVNPTRFRVEFKPAAGDFVRIVRDGLSTANGKSPLRNGMVIGSVHQVERLNQNAEDIRVYGPLLRVARGWVRVEDCEEAEVPAPAARAVGDRIRADEAMTLPVGSVVKRAGGTAWYIREPNNANPSLDRGLWRFLGGTARWAGLPTNSTELEIISLGDAPWSVQSHDQMDRMPNGTLMAQPGTGAVWVKMHGQWYRHSSGDGEGIEGESRAFGIRSLVFTFIPTPRRPANLLVHERSGYRAFADL